ncbi:hypothetical protein I4U23_031575 [Adineta vaga]|nr:hypothetical protein I4U23_031575 [Adineta vaga]
MYSTNGFQEGSQTDNEPPDLNPDYWQEKMNKDHQFVQYMMEIYKKQQVDIRKTKGYEKPMNHQMNNQAGQQITKQLPRLTDQAAQESPSLRTQPFD